MEERDGFPGALRTLGAVGGHIGAPHEVILTARTGSAGR